MTIVAGAACPEGLVIAGDSRSSATGPAGLRTATDYARKLFAFDNRFVAATFGWSTLEGKTIAGHAHDFDKTVPIHGDIHVAAAELCEYFHARIEAHIAAGWDPAPDPGGDPLGFIVGGYDDAGVGCIKRVWPYSETVFEVCRTNDPGGLWNGEIDVMLRLIKGYDSARVDASTWPDAHQSALTEAEYITNFGWFALQDAVDWAMFVARTTIDTQRFTNGTVGSPGSVPTCGGEIDLATITPEGVRWIRRADLRA